MKWLCNPFKGRRNKRRWACNLNQASLSKIIIITKKLLNDLSWVRKNGMIRQYSRLILSKKMVHMVRTFFIYLFFLHFTYSHRYSVYFCTEIQTQSAGYTWQGARASYRAREKQRMQHKVKHVWDRESSDWRKEEGEKRVEKYGMGGDEMGLPKSL